VDTVFGEHDVRRPDILFFRKDREHLIARRSLKGAPDLCVEIVGPSSVQIDREDKFEQYARGGVAYYWIIDPQQRTIEGYELHEGRYRPTASGRDQAVVNLPPFADLGIPLGELWFPE
jgi:Uma2 family endonuclease